MTVVCLNALWSFLQLVMVHRCWWLLKCHIIIRICGCIRITFHQQLVLLSDAIITKRTSKEPIRFFISHWAPNQTLKSSPAEKNKCSICSDSPSSSFERWPFLCSHFFNTQVPHHTQAYVPTLVQSGHWCHLLRNLQKPKNPGFFPANLADGMMMFLPMRWLSQSQSGWFVEVLQIFVQTKFRSTRHHKGSCVNNLHQAAIAKFTYQDTSHTSASGSMKEGCQKKMLRCSTQIGMVCFCFCKTS